MSDINNPYSAPSANLAQDVTSGDFSLLPAPRRLSAGRGWGWVTEGFQYFKRSPLHWILGMVVGFVVILASNFVPVIGQIAYALTMYVLVGGVMLGCHAQSKGQPFEVKHVFAGFKNPKNLMILSAVISLVWLAIMVATMGSSYLQLLSGSSDPAAAAETIGDPKSFMTKIVIAMLLFVPLSMATWYAPALIAINDMPIVAAMQASFNGCAKNMLPLLVFGLVGIVFYILAAIPIGLGLFVFLPTFTAASYVAYREIFTVEPASMLN